MNYVFVFVLLCLNREIECVKLTNRALPEKIWIKVFFYNNNNNVFELYKITVYDYWLRQENYIPGDNLIPCIYYLWFLVSNNSQLGWMMSLARSNGWRQLLRWEEEALPNSLVLILLTITVIKKHHLRFIFRLVLTALRPLLNLLIWYKLFNFNEKMIIWGLMLRNARPYW